MQSGINQNEMLPIEQPILLNGGSLAPVNVFHNPVWIPGKPEDAQANHIQNLERLSLLNKQLDEELNKFKPMMNNNQMQGYNSNYNIYQSKSFLVLKFFYLKKFNFK
jgi:hypothetical protein